MADVAMPRLSDSMEEGTIVKWLKSDGDQVSRGEPIVEIETDKANMTYEADADGVLSIVAQEGDTLPVGEPIARIGDAEPKGGGDAEAEDGGASGDEGEEDAGAGAGAGEAEKDEGEAEPAEAQDAGAVDDDAGTGDDAPAEEPAPPSGDDAGDRVKASPVARRLAEEAGVSLADLKGTGPGGRIVKADVEAAAGGGDATSSADGDEGAASGGDAEAPHGDAKAPDGDAAQAGDAGVPAPITGAAEGGTAKGQTRTEDLSRSQQLIARRMAESKATAPDFQLTVEVDMEAAVELRKELRSADPSGPSPSFNDLVVKASALALRDFPRANGAYRDGKFETYSRVNVGIAVAAEGGLVVPTIFDADRKSLGEIARDSRAVAERARARKITPPELSGGTFTVSNLGMYGIRRFAAVINPPQAAILSVGSLDPRAVVRDGEVVARATMELTLVCDHRILYGADAAEFLAKIRERLEQPLMLAL